MQTERLFVPANKMETACTRCATGDTSGALAAREMRAMIREHARRNHVIDIRHVVARDCT